MSRQPLTRSVVVLRFPRVSGDEPKRDLTFGEDRRFSPRERG